jgi:S-DNA-T family DNA segregation ATPase FtsK/SpoIIIE
MKNGNSMPTISQDQAPFVARTAVEVTHTDRIVGAVAFRLTEAKFAPLLEDSEFNGAFYVLSGFSPAQLAGFVEASQQDPCSAEHLCIRFPASELEKYEIPKECLVHASAVSIRNEDHQGKVVITTDTEPDVAASLGNKVTIQADQLKEADEAARTWIRVVSAEIGLTLPPELEKQVAAMIRGLFECGRFSTGTAAKFIFEVLSSFKEGTPLLRAAGMRLPALDLPLFEDCFLVLGAVKSGQPSQWRKIFENHQKQECYLNKRQPNGLLLDPDQLRKKLDQLREDDSAQRMPESLIDAFSAYIEGEGTRSQITEDLLFKYDWSRVRNCFDKQRKTTSRDFAERTLVALELSGITTTEDDKAVLKALEHNPRKSGEATEEFREFFENYSEAFSHDPKLLFEWEDFVYGRRIVCSDFFEGILEFLQRTLRIRTPGREAWIVIEGDRQSKPKHFESADPHICRFFERHYGKLPVYSGNKIRFDKSTLLPDYSVKVQPILEEAKKKKKARSRKSGKSFEFHVSIYEDDNSGGTRLTTLPLSWNFPKGSVLGLEGADLDALRRYLKQSGKTALAEGLANYETVGGKGVPLTLSLHSIQGFAPSPGASGKGSFIPAQTKINSLAGELIGIFEHAETNGWLPEEVSKDLRQTFAKFDQLYSKAVESLATDALQPKYVAPMAAAYRNLADLVCTIQHESTRRRLTRSILRIGTASVAKSGHRPTLAIICPWHPLRMEASAARNQQLLDTFKRLLSNQRLVFSDGVAGHLFFREMREVMSYPLQPEITVCWESMEPLPRVVTQAIGAYTLHEPIDHDIASRVLEDRPDEAVRTIMETIQEYLRLQPHERDNLTVLLYNCGSPELPAMLVDSLNKLNRESKDGKITCQVLLMHQDDNHLRHLYRDLVAQTSNASQDPVESIGEFLAKVRINITAASRLKRESEGRSQPVNIAYCRDLLYTEGKMEWEWVIRQTKPPIDLYPHQWNRLRPFQDGNNTVRVMLCCPAQTETGWSFLHAIASVCANGTDNAWDNGKCPVPMRMLNFDNQKVDRIIRETHELAVWVVNQDELLDRRLLEQKQIKVIRYIQSATQGRNLVISSKARDTLLVNTIKERLHAILPSDTSPELIQSLVKRVMDDANGISGALVLKAARRANNTSELLGMVLSRYLVQSELGKDRAAAWCFLDDYSHWLGKKEGANISDLLVLAPTWKADGMPHLDIIVTEAKFIAYEGLSSASSSSARQLSDTLVQISEALSPDPKAFDQKVWLARISDMILARTTGKAGGGSIPSFDPEEWRTLVRNRDCTFSVWGYSHVFVHSPMGIDTPVSVCRGIENPKAKTGVQALQEVFGPDLTRSLLLHLHDGNHGETRLLRTQLGHPGFNAGLVRKLAQKPEATSGDQTLLDPSEHDEETAISSPIPIDVSTEEIMKTVQSEHCCGEGGGLTDPSIISADKGRHGRDSVSAEDSPRESLMAYLAQCASSASVSLEEGRQWLEKITVDLRHALLARGLSAKLVEDFKPILTPNAAIIKLQGSKDMTVQAVEAKAEEIYTSNGIRIISATPESGRVSISVARPDRQILYYSQVLLDLFRGSPDKTYSERLLVGIREEDGQPMFLDPLKQPHTLVAGITGSGKSVLIQNLILYIALTRSPVEAQIHLIDAKFGVDYRPLDLLPHVQAGSKTIIDDPETALISLENLVNEMNHRYQLFKEDKVKDYRDYRKATGKPLPTLWLIHDEFADWMQTEDYSKHVPDIVGRLSIKARAAGIFLIFAAQRPDNTVMPMQLRSQLGNRLILKVDSPGTSEISMGEKNAGAEKLLGHGHMLVKTGETTNPVFVQVPYMDMSDVPRIVQFLRLIHGLPPSDELP